MRNPIARHDSFYISGRFPGDDSGGGGPSDEGDTGISSPGRLRRAVAAGAISRRIPPGVVRNGEGWVLSGEEVEIACGRPNRGSG